MTKEELSASANAAADISPAMDMSMPDAVLWLMMYCIYHDYKSGKITAEQGKKLKKQAYSLFAKNDAEYDITKRIIKQRANMWIEIDSAATAYAHSQRTPEGDALYEAIYNVKLKKIEGDDSNGNQMHKL